MTDQPKPVAGQGTTPAPAQQENSDSATLNLLVQLLLAERQDAMLERQEKQRSLKARDEQRRINSQYNKEEKEKIQRICTHKKGGTGIKSPKVDYAVYFHTFTDQKSYIRCQICGMKWRKQDTSDFLHRKGQQIPNHTGLGWRDAYRMLSESTNTASSSEVMMSAIPVQANDSDQD